MDVPLKTHIYNEGTSKVIVFGEYALIKAGIDAWKAEYSKRSRAMTGSFGVVYRVQVDGIYYFIKRLSLDPDQLNTLHRKNILREIQALITLTRKIPNAVSNLIAGILIDKPDLNQYQTYLMFEGPPGYNLEEYLKKTKSPDYHKLYCSIKSAQIALNGAGYVHRDIKPANIFVEIHPATGEFIRCKLIDLGFTIPTGTKTGRAGTPKYWPRTMNKGNTYISEHKGQAGVYQNDHSVNTIWADDFGQTVPPPNDIACLGYTAYTTKPLLVPRPPLVPRPQTTAASNIAKAATGTPIFASPLPPIKRKGWLPPKNTVVPKVLADTVLPPVIFAPKPPLFPKLKPEPEKLSETTQALVNSLARAPSGGRKTRVKRTKRAQRKTRVKH